MYHGVLSDRYRAKTRGIIRLLLVNGGWLEKRCLAVDRNVAPLLFVYE